MPLNTQERPVDRPIETGRADGCGTAHRGGEHRMEGEKLSKHLSKLNLMPFYFPGLVLLSISIKEKQR